MVSYAVLAQRLADDIHAGRLAPGTRLPTHRDLARRHGVALATASRVYAQLRTWGLVVGETGRGTYVRDRPMQTAWDADDEARSSRDVIDLSFNHPPAEGQPELLRTMLRSLAASGDLAALMHQQPPGGRPHERAVVAGYLAARGIAVAIDRIFFVNGAQQGLDSVVRALLAPGDRVAVDSLTYPGFKLVAREHGIVCVPVPWLAERVSDDTPGRTSHEARHDSPAGPDFAALEAACRTQAVRAIYVMPTMHNPLGWVLDVRQREQLVALARRYDCLLIEDATYAFLASEAPPPLVVMAPERTCYIASLSKSVASGLRFGYVVVPPACTLPVKRVLRASLWSLPSLMTAMATRWIADGTVTRLEAARREDAGLRQAIARAAFNGMAPVAHPQSLFVWLPLPGELRADRIARALARQQIAVSRAEAYATTRHVPQALRLGLSSVPLAELATTLRTVRAVIDQFPP